MGFEIKNIILFTLSALKMKYLDINLAKYKYERELENSPCISPDGNAILKMVVVYDKPRGGEGYVLGFAHFKDTNEKRWI